MSRFKIFSNGELINVIIADEEFCKEYCNENSYTYELDIVPPKEPVPPEPTTADILNVLLGVTE